MCLTFIVPMIDENKEDEMTDTSYFHTLTPRQQLNDLMHKYAQVNHVPYGESWRELERRYYRRHRVRISYMKYLYCRNHSIRMTRRRSLKPRTPSIPPWRSPTKWQDMRVPRQRRHMTVKEDVNAVPNHKNIRPDPRGV
jgi:hypothetical protein